MKPIRMLALSLTGQCNFACVYCYAVKQNKDLMDFATAKKAIDLAAQSGEPFILQLTGGEPLLNYECIKQILHYARKNKSKALPQIQTNGSLLTQEIALFLKANACAIGISLDGRPETNDALRKLPNGKGATQEILRGLNVLRDNNMGCGITCVVTNENVNHLSGIVDMAYYLGNIKRIGFDLLRGQGRGNELKQPEGKEVQAAINEVYQKAQLLTGMTKRQINFSQLERVHTLACSNTPCFGHCYAMNGEAAFVDAKGDIYACSSLIGDADYFLGNVEQGIIALRQQEVAAKIKASMRFCFTCNDFKLCGGGCYARWLNSNCAGPYTGECALKKKSIEWYKKVKTVEK